MGVYDGVGEGCRLQVAGFRLQGQGGGSSLRLQVAGKTIDEKGETKKNDERAYSHSLFTSHLSRFIIHNLYEKDHHKHIIPMPLRLLVFICTAGKQAKHLAWLCYA